MTKMVQLSDEAYGRLRALKKGDESFSDVVLRLVPKGDLRDLRKLGRSRAEIDAHVREIRDIDALDRP
jgi:predicted CopG family antitoxin